MQTPFDALYKGIPFYTPLEIALNKSDDFLRIRETLTRVGVGSFGKKELWQMCHIVHHKGRYYILHYQEMLAKNGFPYKLSPTDIRRRNNVAKLLEEWGLCMIKSGFGGQSDQKLRVISYRDKNDWTLLSKLDEETKSHAKVDSDPGDTGERKDY